MELSSVQVYTDGLFLLRASPPQAACLALLSQVPWVRPPPYFIDVVLYHSESAVSELLSNKGI